jgi:hypothetical protein
MKSTNKEPQKESRDTKKERTARNIVSLTLSDKEQRVMERITKAT